MIAISLYVKEALLRTNKTSVNVRSRKPKSCFLFKSENSVLPCESRLRDVLISMTVYYRKPIYMFLPTASILSGCINKQTINRVM